MIPVVVVTMVSVTVDLAVVVDIADRSVETVRPSLRGVPGRTAGHGQLRLVFLSAQTALTSGGFQW
jgi:hypothetical protein